MDFSQQGLMGALAQLAQAQQQGTQRADAAYGALAGHLQEPMDRSGALMRMAQGFMSPTRTGGFAESAGLAIGGYADARDRMQDMDLARRKKLAEIEAARARLGMEGAQNRFNIFQTGHGLQQQAEQQRINSLIHGGGGAAIPADGAMTLNDIAPSGMGAPILSSSGFDAPVIRPGADMPAAGASPAGDLIPPVNEGSFFIPPGDTGQSRRIRQSEADMFGMPEGMDQRPAPGYSLFDDAGMMGTLPDRGAADSPAQGAGARQASPQPQGRSRGDGFRVANDEVGDLGSLMSPDMAMTPEQGRRFEAQPQARQAPAQGRQTTPEPPERQRQRFSVRDNLLGEYKRLVRLGEQHPEVRAAPEYREAMQGAIDNLNKFATSDTRNFEAARSDPEFREFLLAMQGAKATQVNMPPQIGSIPPGYQVQYDDQGRPTAMSPLPGSPADQDAQAEEQRQEARRASQQRAGQTVLRAVNRGLEEFLPDVIQGDGVGPTNARVLRAGIRGTPEFNLMTQIEDFRSNIGLDRLQQMREESPTGGALGQVPFQQQQRLERVLGDFDLGQPLGVLKENLQELNNIYLDIMYGNADERARLVEEGRMDADRNQQISRMYHDTLYDEFGRRRDRSQDDAARQPPQEGGSTSGVRWRIVE